MASYSSGFSSSAFSGNAFNLETSSVEEGTAKGGWFAYPEKRRKPKKELDKERIALGILPSAVAKTVTKIARKAIQKATEQREIDVLMWAMQDDQQTRYERQLRLELSRQKQIWDAAYTRIFEIAVQEALQAEEEAVLMLMMEL